MSYWDDSLTLREKPVYVATHMQFSTAGEVDGKAGWVIEGRLYGRVLGHNQSGDNL